MRIRGEASELAVEAGRREVSELAFGRESVVAKSMERVCRRRCEVEGKATSWMGERVEKGLPLIEPTMPQN